MSFKKGWRCIDTGKIHYFNGTKHNKDYQSLCKKINISSTKIIKKSIRPQKLLSIRDQLCGSCMILIQKGDKK